jgi:hypothetical protein
MGAENADAAQRGEGSRHALTHFSVLFLGLSSEYCGLCISFDRTFSFPLFNDTKGRNVAPCRVDPGLDEPARRGERTRPLPGLVDCFYGWRQSSRLDSLTACVCSASPDHLTKRPYLGERRAHRHAIAQGQITSRGLCRIASAQVPSIARRPSNAAPHKSPPQRCASRVSPTSSPSSPPSL